ncbi:MAG: TolC family protein [Rikenellaceae bacterium]
MKRLILCRSLLCSLLLTLCVGTGMAQEGSTKTIAMTLEQCLKFAKENSITLKQYALSIDDSIADELAAKGVFLPTVAASVGQYLSASPLSTESSKSYYSGSYGVDLSMPIYNAGKNKASYEQSKLSIEMAELSLEEQQNALEVSVTEVFVQMLYAMEQIEVAKNSLILTQKSLERGKAYLEVGSINKSDFAQLQSANADSEYDLILAQTTLSTLQVSLKQLLEISQDVTLSVIAPQTDNASIMNPLSSVQEVYKSALTIRPEIGFTKLLISSAKYDEEIAKAGYMPTVSLTAGVGVSHISSSSYTFSGQLRNNFDTSVGVSVSVPIFSNYKNKSATIKAQNAVTSANLSHTDSEKVLYQTIETLYNNAYNAQAKYSVADYKLQASETSLKLTTEQYNLGMKNIIELLTEQDNYRESAQEYITNKYQFILNRALLEFYKTDQIKL